MSGGAPAPMKTSWRAIGVLLSRLRAVFRTRRLDADLDDEIHTHLELLAAVADRTEAPVIASGGVSSLEDLRAIATLTDRGVEGAIVGKALYAGRFTLPQALAAVRA